jgi:hypothetical protein
MSGTLGFLFQGQPTPPQPTGSDTQTSYPLWLQQYEANIANAANGLAQQNYTPFPGQQVAQPSAATQQSWNMATGQVGNYQPALNQATQYTKQAATPITAGDINTYMSPYMDKVIGGLQSASNYNLFTNQLPQIQSQFVSAGQAASPQQQQAYNNALYQSNQALDQATSQALQQGYGQAVGTALQEQSAKQVGGAQMGQLGALQQQLGEAQTGEVAAAGQGQDLVNQSNINAALNNFYAQQQWPYQNLAYASNIVRGLQVPTNTQTVGVGYYPNTYSASPLSTFVGTALGANSLGGTSNSLSLRRGGRVQRRGMATVRAVAA